MKRGETPQTFPGQHRARYDDALESHDAGPPHAMNRLCSAVLLPVTCDPYGTEPGGTEPDVCPEGEAHFTGDPGCTPVGAPCPAGDFPVGLPSDSAVVYVLAAAPPGGDGSAASPLSTITEGLALAAPGTIVAIGKGEYGNNLDTTSLPVPGPASRLDGAR